MLKMRYFEEKIVDVYPLKIMRTPVHLGIGQEAVAAGILSARNPADVVFTHHRSHNAYIGCGGKFAPLFAELMGKNSGISRGKGGSVHISERSLNFAGSSAILGEAIALAAGAAFAQKYFGNIGISIVFFGDAALEGGIFWETLNFCILHELPILFVCENNEFSTESHIGKRLPSHSSFKSRVESFGCESITINGNDILAVYEEGQKLINCIQTDKHPRFLECKTYRWREHVGTKYDWELGRTYRSRLEVENKMLDCPIQHFEDYLLNELRIFTTSDLRAIRDQIKSEIETEYRVAESAEIPDLKELTTNVWSVN